MNNVSSFWDKSNCYFAEVIKNYDPFHPNQVLIQSIPVPAVHYSTEKENRKKEGQAWVSLISNIIGSRDGENSSSGYGFHHVPEVGSIVVVLRFDEGTKSSGEDFILGTFWHHNMKIPVINNPVTKEAFKDEKIPDLQSFTTSDGTIFLIDESEVDKGKSTFSIYNPNTDFKVVIENDNDKTNLTVDVPGDVDMNSLKNLSLYGGQTVGFEGDNIEITADGDNLQFSSNGTIDMSSKSGTAFKGKEIHLNKQTSSVTTKPVPLKTASALSMLELTDIAVDFKPLQPVNSKGGFEPKDEKPQEISRRVEVPLTICYVEDENFTLYTPFWDEESFDCKTRFSFGGGENNNAANENQNADNGDKKAADKKNDEEDILGNPNKLLASDFDFSKEEDANVCLNVDNFDLFNRMSENYGKSLKKDAENKDEENPNPEDMKKADKPKPDGYKKKSGFKLYGNKLKLKCSIELKFCMKVKDYKAETKEYEIDKFDVKVENNSDSIIKFPKQFIENDVHYIVTDVLEYGFKRAISYIPTSMTTYDSKVYRSTLFGMYTILPKNDDEVMEAISTNFKTQFLNNVIQNYNDLNGAKVCIDRSEIVVVLKVKKKPDDKIFVRFNYVAPKSDKNNPTKKNLAFYSSKVQSFDLETNIQNAFISMIDGGNDGDGFEEYRKFKDAKDKGLYLKKHQLAEDYAVSTLDDDTTLFLNYAKFHDSCYGNNMDEVYNGANKKDVEQLDKLMRREYLETDWSTREIENDKLAHHSNFFLTYPLPLDMEFCVKLMKNGEKDKKKFDEYAEYEDFKNFDEKRKLTIYLINSANAYLEYGVTPSQIEAVGDYVEFLTRESSSNMFSEIIEEQKNELQDNSIDSKFFTEDYPLEVFLLADIQTILPVNFLVNQFVLAKKFDHFEKRTNVTMDISNYLNETDRYAFSYSTFENCFTESEFDEIIDKYKNGNVDVLIPLGADGYNDKFKLADMLFFFYGSEQIPNLFFASVNIIGKYVHPYLIFSKYAAYERLLFMLYTYYKFENNQEAENKYSDADIFRATDSQNNLAVNGSYNAFDYISKKLMTDLLQRNSSPYFSSNLYETFPGIHSVRIIGKDNKNANGTYEPVLEGIFEKGDRFPSNDNGNILSEEGNQAKYGHIISDYESDSYKNMFGVADPLKMPSDDEIEKRIDKYFGKPEGAKSYKFKEVETGMNNIKWEDTIYTIMEGEVNPQLKNDFRIAKFYTSYWRLYEFHKLYGLIFEGLFLVPFGMLHMIRTDLI